MVLMSQVLIDFRKVASVSKSLNSRGREFHSLGARCAKDLPPHLALLILAVFSSRSEQDLMLLFGTERLIRSMILLGPLYVRNE